MQVQCAVCRCYVEQTAQNIQHPGNDLAAPNSYSGYWCATKWSARMLAHTQFRSHKCTDLRAHNFAHSAHLWHQLRLANCNYPWSRRLYGGPRTIASATGWAEVDTWPLIHGGCYHVTEVGGSYGLCESRWRSFKMTRTLWNYSKYRPMLYYCTLYVWWWCTETVLLSIFDILTPATLREDTILVMMFRGTLLPPSSVTSHNINAHTAMFPKTVTFKFTFTFPSLCGLLHTVLRLNK